MTLVPFPVLIHPAFPGTATTTIQASLEADAGDALFAGRGPGMDRRQDAWLFPQLTDAIRRVAAGCGVADIDIESLQETLLDAVTAKGKRWLILSDERICKPPRARKLDWRVMQARGLKQLFGDAQILLTLRRQDELLHSLFRLARLKGLPATTTFSAWLDQGGGSDIAPWQERFDFLRYYRGMVEVFGHERVHIASYEAYTTSSAGLMPLLEAVCPGTTCRISLVERLNETHRTRSPLARLARRGLNMLRSKSEYEVSPQVTNHDLAAVRSQFAASNKALADESGIALPGYSDS